MVGWVDRIQLNMDGVSGAQGGEEEKLRDIENRAPHEEKPVKKQFQLVDDMSST